MKITKSRFQKRVHHEKKYVTKYGGWIYGNHFPIYTTIEPLGYTSEVNRMLCVNCTSIKKSFHW